MTNKARLNFSGVAPFVMAGDGRPPTSFADPGKPKTWMAGPSPAMTMVARPWVVHLGGRHETVLTAGLSSDLKAICDYELGPDAVVPHDKAAAAIETADRFVDCIASLLKAG